MKEAWYETWFDSNYYHILYQNPDEQEAKEFLQNLVHKLSLQKDGKIIDVGCGKGRHSIFLNGLGFEVQGIDLSVQSIQVARSASNERLSFDVHDMREVFKPGHYDYVFNLFTSFGYFDEDHDDHRSLVAMSRNLKKGGLLVLDYLNTVKVERELSKEMRQEFLLSNIRFRTSKRIRNNFIEKHIEIEDGDQKLYFMEKVKSLHLHHFKSHIESVGLHIEALFGDYHLTPFDPESSDRLIIIARKK